MSPSLLIREENSFTDVFQQVSLCFPLARIGSHNSSSFKGGLESKYLFFFLSPFSGSEQERKVLGNDSWVATCVWCVHRYLQAL